jgi:hypothetical protein
MPARIEAALARLKTRILDTAGAEFESVRLRCTLCWRERDFCSVQHQNTRDGRNYNAISHHR